MVTVCSDKNNALCKKYGADEVAAYNNGEEALKAALQAHAPFDCAYDTGHRSIQWRQVDPVGVADRQLAQLDVTGG